VTYVTVALQPESVDTGFVAANAQEFPVPIWFALEDDFGKIVYFGTREIPSNGQVTLFLGELNVGPKSFRGILRLSTGYPVSAAGLRARYNERGDYLLTTLPDVFTGSAPVFPLVVAGAGYATDFTVYGSYGTEFSGALNLFSQSGQLLKMDLRVLERESAEPSLQLTCTERCVRREAR
jgi:hypothetical protein